MRFFVCFLVMFLLSSYRLTHDISLDNFQSEDLFDPENDVTTQDDWSCLTNKRPAKNEGELPFFSAECQACSFVEALAFIATGLGVGGLSKCPHGRLKMFGNGIRPSLVPNNPI